MEQGGGLGRGVWAAGSTGMERLRNLQQVRVRGRERVGLGPECVYGTEVTVRACYVNLCLCAFHCLVMCAVISSPHLSLNPVEQA